MSQLFLEFVKDPNPLKVLRFFLKKIARFIIIKVICKPMHGFMNQWGYITPYYLASSTEDELDSFLKKLWPVKTQYELIRVGGDGDGGYLIPNDLKKIGACFSPGVAGTSTFEEFFANRKVKCFLADYSVEEPPLMNDFFDFEKKFLGKANDGIYITLESWIKQKYSGKEDLILQMDIENAEYEVLFNTSAEVLKKFRIMVIEFHRLEMLANKMTLQSFEHCFGKILANFEVVHIHPNNVGRVSEYKGYKLPSLLEFTFLRKDRIKTKSYATEFPHPLDKKNGTNFPDLTLPKSWYKSK